MNPLRHCVPAVPFSGRYCRFLRGVMAPDCRWLLWAVEYDTSRYPGPPHALPEPEIRRDLGELVRTAVK